MKRLERMKKAELVNKDRYFRLVMLLMAALVLGSKSIDDDLRLVACGRLVQDRLVVLPPADDRSGLAVLVEPYSLKRDAKLGFTRS